MTMTYSWNGHSTSKVPIAYFVLLRPRNLVIAFYVRLIRGQLDFMQLSVRLE